MARAAASTILVVVVAPGEVLVDGPVVSVVQEVDVLQVIEDVPVVSAALMEDSVPSKGTVDHPLSLKPLPPRTNPKRLTTCGLTRTDPPNLPMLSPHLVLSRYVGQLRLSRVLWRMTDSS